MKRRRMPETVTTYCEYCGSGATYIVGSIAERQFRAAHGPYCQARTDTRPHPEVSE